MAEQQEPLYGPNLAVSPTSLAYRRQLAMELMKQGLSSEPIRSPWQGVGRIVQALVGGYESSKEDKEEKEARRKQIADALEAYRSGDPAKMLAAGLNPFNPEGAQKELVSRSFPHNVDTGGFVQPQNPITGGAANAPFEKQIPGQQSAGDVSQPTIITPTQQGAPPPAGIPPQNPMAPIVPKPVQTVPPPASMRPQMEGQPATFGQRFTFDPAATPKTLDDLFAKGQQFNDQRARQAMGIKARSDDFERGQGAPERINAIRTLADAYKSGGDNISGGPLGKKIVELKQLFNQVTGVDLGGLPESEIITHANQGLAGALAKSLSSRGATNNEFNQMMAANPGVMMSNAGARYMLNLMEQQEAQSQKLGLAGQNVSPENYAQFKQGFYQDPGNQLVSPFSGKPLAGATVAADMEALKAAHERETAGRAKAGMPSGWKIERAQ